MVEHWVQINVGPCEPAGTGKFRLPEMRRATAAKTVLVVAAESEQEALERAARLLSRGLAFVARPQATVDAQMSMSVD